MPNTQDTAPSTLPDDTARLAAAMETLSRHRFVRIHDSTLRLMWFQFLRGLAFGLGSAVGATALVSFAVLLLSQIEFVPILGDLATEIIDEIQVQPAEVAPE